MIIYKIVLFFIVFIKKNISNFAKKIVLKFTKNIKRKIKKINLFSIFFIFFLFFFSSKISAEVSFSEINYDPEGVDTGYEWVEVFNNDLSEVDFSEYKFCEGGSCHNIYAHNENRKKLPKNNFAILSSNPEKFLEKNNDFSGFLFNSSFSLKNSGTEKFELKNKDKNIVSILNYNSEIGGKNGDTLSIIDNILKNSQATPGSKNIEKIKTEEEDNKNHDNKNNNLENKEKDIPKIQRTYVQIQDDSSDLLDGKKKVKVVIKPMDMLIAGGNHIFEANVMELSGADIEKPEQIKYFWNFGDGQISNKKNPDHTYISSGEYVISLKVLINSWSGNTKVIVKVIDTPVSISDINYENKEITLKNNSDFIINISGFKIVSQNNFFEIPKETFIGSGKSIKFVNEITKLKFDKNYPIALTYKNNKVIKIFKKDFYDEIKKNILSEIENIENKIKIKENELKNFENKKWAKKQNKNSELWNISEKELNELKNLKYQAEKEKILVELYDLKAKRRKIRISLEKAELGLKKAKEKDEEKKTKDEENYEKKVKNEFDNNIQKENFQKEEKVYDLQKINSELKNNEKDDKINEKSKKESIFEKMKNLFIEKIFYFALLILILIFSIFVYVNKKFANKFNEKKEKNIEEENEYFDDWDIEDIDNK